MSNNTKIISDLKLIIEQNESFTHSCLIAGELIQGSVSDFLPILQYENNDSYIEVDVEVLQKLVSNCKIAENIVNQAALKTFENKRQFEDYCKDKGIELDTYSTFFEKFKIPSAILVSYQKYLIKNKYLIDDNMTNFLDYLESDQKDNASFSYEELSYEQKKSIPETIFEWING